MNAVQELEHEVRGGIAAEADEDRMLVVHREREALQRLQAAAYARRVAAEVENTMQRSVLKVDPAAQRELDGYRGAWRRQYRDFLHGRLRKKREWEHARQLSEQRLMELHERASRPANDFYHASVALEHSCRAGFVALLEAHAASLQFLAADARTDADRAAEDERARLRLLAQRMRDIEDYEEGARQSIVHDFGTAMRETAAREERARDDLVGIERRLNHSRARAMRREETQRAELEAEEAAAWAKVFDLAEASARASLGEEAAYEHAELTDKINADRIRVAFNAALGVKVAGLSAEQSKARSALVWMETSCRRELAAKFRAAR